jgi:hypothetical protein
VSEVQKGENSSFLKVNAECIIDRTCTYSSCSIDMSCTYASCSIDRSCTYW